MASNTGRNGVDLWSEIIASEQQQQQSHVEVFYRRRKASKTPSDVVPPKQLGSEGDGIHHRLSLVPPAQTKRISWNRSLSTRGRTSIAVGTCINHQPQLKKAKRKGKPPRPKGKHFQPPNFEMERVYFEEVDAFELLEESPSPKNFGTWAGVNQTDSVALTHLSTRLNKWLICKNLNYSCGPSSTLSKILGTPSITLGPLDCDNLDSEKMKTPEKSSAKACSRLPHAETTSKSYKVEDVGNEGSEELEASVKKLSLASTSSSDAVQFNPFATLLAVCEQSVPFKFQDVFSKYCDPQEIIKIGEGTFGEAFMAGSYVCKIVPIDGDFRVNGEVQKRSEELLEEVVLSRTLNCLRQHQEDARNVCSTFIGTIDLKVCQGSYDATMIKAWEEWDENNGSENDHPNEFPDKQRYVMFVLEHGGKDLENFVLLNFNEALTFLVQVTAALAVAEAAYEFEHRDMHWGNVLLSRNDSATVQFILEGKKMSVKTFGLSVSIIDFTLSRINTGEDILFLDLSSDPYLFKGPKGDKQSETYRKMKELTEDCWEGSFPKTNVLWLQYLVDILLLKKSFERTSKNERDLRSLKKRLEKYCSAKEAIFDPFFSDLLVEHVQIIELDD
ncbi:serine/threonine-protein kinase haspin homolog isoform X2 [Humulus lupulus]|uniref:serine/threonine-protein kinase haspin homolog isoform X2 n=1 Tax=Humulus lupulus TaxID=3486 RepID=UPI002B414D58|nr:serine/threonine-protein kinase haspin homolog isoform X2 [Humulus lupulus]